MLWLALMAGGIGFLFGLCLFRVQLIVAASATLIPLCIGIAPVVHWTPLVTSVGVFVLATALQGGYLVGAGVASTRSRVKGAGRTSAEIRRPTRVVRMQGNVSSRNNVGSRI